jgi:hypothetical protein
LFAGSNDTVDLEEQDLHGLTAMNFTSAAVACAACAAGLLHGLALASEQIAALLTQQQQQQQQQAATSVLEAFPVLAKLLSPATAYRLLDVWVWLVEFAPWSALGYHLVLGTAELVPTIEPACKLAAAAVRKAMQAAAAGTLLSAAPTSSSSSRRRRIASSSDSRSADSTWRSTPTDAQLLERAVAAAFEVSTAINNEYRSLCKRLEDAAEAQR